MGTNLTLWGPAAGFWSPPVGESFSLSASSFFRLPLVFCCHLGPTCLITVLLSAVCSKKSVEQVEGRCVTGQTCLTCNWSLRSSSFIDLHLTCMTDTALLPGHEMVLFALLRFCCWTDERWWGFLSFLLSFIGWIALFLVGSCFLVPFWIEQPPPDGVICLYLQGRTGTK